MASTLQTGITAAAVNKYLRGPGKAYKDFESIAVPGTLLGETKGGSTFDWGLEFHDVEPDGAMGLIEGHRFISKCIPSLEVNLLENTATSWTGGFLPAGDSTNETPTAIVEYLGSGSAVRSSAPTLIGAANTIFSTLQIWYGAASTDAVQATITTDYTVATGTGVVTFIATASGGSIADADEVTAKYTYDSTASGDAYNVITPGQVAAADHWTNIALVCELSNQTYTNPYCVFIVKNCLSEAGSVTIPSGALEEAVLPIKFFGFFNPADGLTLANAPVEFWLGAV